MPELELIDTFQRLAVALGIGFLLGVERGWRHRNAADGTRAAGLRTHAVIGLSGGICGALLPAIGGMGFAALALAFSAVLLAFKLRESARDNDVSATGSFAALLVFALGAYCMNGDLRVAAAVGVALVGLMAFKDALHDWLDTLTWEELRSALLILAASAIALPLLPDRAVDPWGAINPRELWLLTILVAGASFAGYVAVRVLGRGIGVAAGAAVGALVSSTIVTAELGRRVRAGEVGAASAAGAACLAAAVSVTRVAVFVAVAVSPAFLEVGPVALSAVLALGVGSFLLQGRGDAISAANQGVRNPLDLGSVAQFALFLGGVIIAGRIIAEAYGQAGLLSFAATAGLVDVDAVTLAAGSFLRGGQPAGHVGQAILLAVLMNTLAKVGIAAFAGGWRYGGLFGLGAAGAVLLAGAVWRLAGPLLVSMVGLSLPLGEAG
jgi:uncharacterized membrane protein (DUF4010 family)